MTNKTIISFITIPLISLVFLTILSLLSGNNFISTALSQSQIYQQSLNTSISELELPSADISLTFDPFIQAVIWISIISIVAIASSITVVGSGLSGTGVRWLIGAIAFVSVWIMFSTYPFPLIISFGDIGVIIYLVMTIFYAFGGIWFLIEGSGG